jgi:very-short-patch-repair endonuclease
MLPPLKKGVDERSESGGFLNKPGGFFKNPRVRFLFKKLHCRSLYHLEIDMIYYRQRLKSFSRQLRTDMTDAEQLLWKTIRRKQLSNIQFYRQKPIGNYIVDFYAPAAKLVIELDGGQHFFDKHLKQDKRRDTYLLSQGLKVLRFDNGQVLRGLGDVLDEIYREIESVVLNPPGSLK